MRGFFLSLLISSSIPPVLVKFKRQSNSLIYPNHLKMQDSASRERVSTLLSSKTWHFIVITSGLIIAAITSYQLLTDWSKAAAVFSAIFILYGFILMTANYRLSLRYLYSR
jgi:hypothetical protein